MLLDLFVSVLHCTLWENLWPVSSALNMTNKSANAHYNYVCPVLLNDVSYWSVPWNFVYNILLNEYNIS